MSKNGRKIKCSEAAELLSNFVCVNVTSGRKAPMKCGRQPGMKENL